MAVLGDVAWPPEPVRTERLVLRRTKASDRPAYVELSCSDEVRRFLGGAEDRELVERETPEVPGAYPGVFAVEFDPLPGAPRRPSHSRHASVTGPGPGLAPVFGA